MRALRLVILPLTPAIAIAAATDAPAKSPPTPAAYAGSLGGGFSATWFTRVRVGRAPATPTVLASYP